jgi:hypothetical protein
MTDTLRMSGNMTGVMGAVLYLSKKKTLKT